MSWKKRVGWGLCLGLFLFVFGCVGSKQKDLNAASGALESSQFFTLMNLEGTQTSLATVLQGNKVVLLTFFATWCPPCLEEIPDLIHLQDKYKDRSFTILGLDVGESRRKVSHFVEKMGINYPVVLDEDTDVARAYGVVGIPTSLLVSSDGRILGEYHAATPELFEDVAKAVGEAR